MNTSLAANTGRAKSPLKDLPTASGLKLPLKRLVYFSLAFTSSPANGSTNSLMLVCSYAKSSCS